MYQGRPPTKSVLGAIISGIGLIIFSLFMYFAIGCFVYAVVTGKH